MWTERVLRLWRMTEVFPSLYLPDPLWSWWYDEMTKWTKKDGILPLCKQNRNIIIHCWLSLIVSHHKLALSSAARHVSEECIFFFLSLSSCTLYCTSLMWWSWSKVGSCVKYSGTYCRDDDQDDIVLINTWSFNDSTSSSEKSFNDYYCVDNCVLYEKMEKGLHSYYLATLWASILFLFGKVVS